MHEDRGKIDCRPEEVSGKAVRGKLVSCGRTRDKRDDRGGACRQTLAVGSSAFQGGSGMYKVLVFLVRVISADEAATPGGYP